MIQKALPLQWQDRQGVDNFIVAACNKHAFDTVQNTDQWSGAVLNIIGQRASGKSHLASIFTQKYNPFVVASVEDLEETVQQEPEAIVIDSADDLLRDNKQAQEKLFFLYNNVQSRKAHLLLTMTDQVAEWVIIPDLKSRLQSVQTVSIDDPDEGMVKAAYQKLFMDRGLVVDDQALTFLAYRSERSFHFIRSMVDELDEKALAENRKVTRPFIAKILGTSEDV